MEKFKSTDFSLASDVIDILSQNEFSTWFTLFYKKETQIEAIHFTQNDDGQLQGEIIAHATSSSIVPHLKRKAQFTFSYQCDFYKNGGTITVAPKEAHILSGDPILIVGLILDRINVQVGEPALDRELKIEWLRAVIHYLSKAYQTGAISSYEHIDAIFGVDSTEDKTGLTLVLANIANGKLKGNMLFSSQVRQALLDLGLNPDNPAAQKFLSSVNDIETKALKICRANEEQHLAALERLRMAEKEACDAALESARMADEKARTRAVEEMRTRIAEVIRRAEETHRNELNASLKAEELAQATALKQAEALASANEAALMAQEDRPAPNHEMLSPNEILICQSIATATNTYFEKRSLLANFLIETINQTKTFEDLQFFIKYLQRELELPNSVLKAKLVTPKHLWFAHHLGIFAQKQEKISSSFSRVIKAIKQKALEFDNNTSGDYWSSKCDLQALKFYDRNSKLGDKRLLMGSSGLVAGLGAAGLGTAKILTTCLALGALSATTGGIALAVAGSVLVLGAIVYTAYRLYQRRQAAQQAQTNAPETDMRKPLNKKGYYQVSHASLFKLLNHNNLPPRDSAPGA